MPSHAETPSLIATPSVQSSDWVAVSDTIARDYTLSAAEFDPEIASYLGYDSFDAAPSVPSEEFDRQQRAWIEHWLARIPTLKRDHQNDPNLSLDLRLLADTIQLQHDEMNVLEDSKIVTLTNAIRHTMNAMEFLINDQSPEHRKASAIQRFHHYVRGYKNLPPLCQASQTYMQSRLDRFGDQAIVPQAAEIEDALAKIPSMMTAIRANLESARPDKSWHEDWTAFEKQAEAFKEFLSKTMLPRARKTIPLPPAYYAILLRRMGVDTTPERLIELAQRDLPVLLEEMKKLARAVAAKYNLPSSDIASVVKYLSNIKAKTAEEALATFQHANQVITQTILSKDWFTLPSAPIRMRVGSPDESRAMPIPHVRIPSFVNNTGQRPEFIVPDPTIPEVNGNNTSPAESMTLMAHEGRPGHDLQFSRIFEVRPSIIRAVFAENSTNSEGWALYAEYVMAPTFDDEAHLLGLFWRAVRCMRMMLDPQLQLGKVDQDGVMQQLRSLGMTDEFARIEFKRYSFMYPGQAPSYYFGLLKILELREQAERTHGKDFNPRAFHDAILSYGTVPVDQIAHDVIARSKKSA